MFIASLTLLFSVVGFGSIAALDYSGDGIVDSWVWQGMAYGCGFATMLAVEAWGNGDRQERPGDE